MSALEKQTSALKGQRGLENILDMRNVDGKEIQFIARMLHSALQDERIAAVQIYVDIKNQHLIGFTPIIR